VSTDLVLLAVLMGLVTYPSRALPLLAPAMDRLPRGVLAYLRLVGPAVLAALAATGVMLEPRDGSGATFTVGIEWLAIALTIAVVVRFRNLLGGLVLAVVLVAAARAAGLG
jgi:branched-subunit amino acid transport protein